LRNFHIPTTERLRTNGGLKSRNFHIPTTKKARTRLKLYLEVEEEPGKTEKHRRGKLEQRKKTSSMNKCDSFSLVQGPYLSQLPH
jgi:hypothetical protein